MQKYITKLTNEEIEQFFMANGYALCNNLTTNDDEPLPAIERDDEMVFVRAQNIKAIENNEDLKDFISAKYPAILSIPFLAGIQDTYNNNIDIIHFNDFYLSKLSIFPFDLSDEDEQSSEDALYSAYVKFMDKKFPTYKEDFLKYCEQLQSNENTPEP